VAFPVNRQCHTHRTDIPTPSTNARSIVEWLNQRLFDGTDSSLPPDVAAELEGLLTDAFYDVAADARLEERTTLVED
jgi:hypothetical protein